MKKGKYNIQAETGRSMLEMLGVLAIIGVLSIAGVGGYRMAINKHKANKIAYDATLALTELKTMEDAARNAQIAVNFTPDSGQIVTMLRSSDGYDFAIVKGVPKSLCEKLKDSVGSDGLQIYKNDATNTIFADCTDSNDMRFTSDKPTSGTGTEGTGGTGGEDTPVTNLCDGVVCQNGGSCNNGACDCVGDYTGTNCQTAKSCTAAAGYSAPSCGSNTCCALTGANDSCDNPTTANKTGACGTNGYCAGASCQECNANEQVKSDNSGCECKTGYAGTTCEECTAGYGLNGTTCTQCTANNYSLGGTAACTSCGTGAISTAGASSCACDTASFSSGTWHIDSGSGNGCQIVCPTNSSTTVVNGNQLSDSTCYCNIGYAPNAAGNACETVCAGTIITSSVGNFCKINIISSQSMAKMRCQANGRTLASIYDLCPDWDGSLGYGKCSTTFSGYDVSDATHNQVWTSSLSSGSFYYVVKLDSRNVATIKETGASTYPICK